MDNDLQELLTELGHKFERLVSKRVSARMLAARAALFGEPTAIVSAALNGEPGRPARGTEEYRARLVAEVKEGKLSGRAIARREGIPYATLAHWKLGRVPGKKKNPGGKGVPKKRQPPEYRAKILAEAAKAGAVTEQIEKREGLSRGQIHKWRYMAKHAATNGKNPRPGKRRHFDDDYKRKLVIRAMVMDPSARGLFLHNEGIATSLYSRWSQWVKENPA